MGTATSNDVMRQKCSLKYNKLILFSTLIIKLKQFTSFELYKHKIIKQNSIPNFQ